MNKKVIKHIYKSHDIRQQSWLATTKKMHQNYDPGKIAIVVSMLGVSCADLHGLESSWTNLDVFRSKPTLFFKIDACYLFKSFPQNGQNTVRKKTLLFLCKNFIISIVLNVKMSVLRTNFTNCAYDRSSKTFAMFMMINSRGCSSTFKIVRITRLTLYRIRCKI